MSLAQSKALTAFLILPLVFWLTLKLIGLGLGLLPEPIGPRAQLLSEGASLTFWLTIGAGALGLVFGFFAALMRLAKHKPANFIARFYLWVFRGTPLLTQILFVYYALPALLPWFRSDEFSSALIALALNNGAYNCEVIRSGLLSVGTGQAEAAQVLGMNRWQTLRFIIFPQGLPIMIGPLVGNLIALLKDSAMASSIGLLELTLTGQRISSETFRPAEVLATVALTYLLLTTVIELCSHLMLARKRAPG